jgi:hypothetical protein
MPAKAPNRPTWTRDSGTSPRAAAVRERGDYVLAIKANRGRLFTAVTQEFARSGKRSTAEQIDRSTHDRHEA